MGGNKEIWDNIKIRNMGSIGHILRHDTIIPTLIEGYVEGKKQR